MERIENDKPACAVCMVCCRPCDLDNEFYLCHVCKPDLADVPVLPKVEEEMAGSVPQMMKAFAEEVLFDPAQTRNVVQYLAQMCTEETSKDMPESRIGDTIWSIMNDMQEYESDARACAECSACLCLRVPDKKL